MIEVKRGLKPAPASVNKNCGLFIDAEGGATILVPAFFIFFGAEGFFFAVADGANAAGADSSADEGVFGGIGAACSESEVVFG